MEKLLNEDFWDYIKSNEIKIYNEFSLQHELEFFLRLALKDLKEFNVRFECNINHFFKDVNSKGNLERKYELEIDKNKEKNHKDETEEEKKDRKDKEYLKKYLKKEIDIVLFNDDYSSCHAIELKYPRNGQYPNTLYEFAKDIRFMEQLKESGFESTHCIVLVDQRRISKKGNSQKLSGYCSGETKGIYKYFRSAEPKTELIKDAQKSFKAEEAIPNYRENKIEIRKHVEPNKDRLPLRFSNQHHIEWHLEGENWIWYTVTI